MLNKIIAVDFDGTLCENKWPDIGAPNFKLIELLKNNRANGIKVILWTCRVGTKLLEAIYFCSSHGLYFDAINENVSEVIEEFGSDARKIFAHEYIDDRAASIEYELPFKNTDNIFDFYGDIPCTDKDCYNRGNFHAGCENCNKFIKPIDKEEK